MTSYYVRASRCTLECSNDLQREWFWEEGREQRGKDMEREGEEKGGKKREEKELMTENARKCYIHWYVHILFY